MKILGAHEKLPEYIYVVEIDKHVVLTCDIIKFSIFPCYMFDFSRGEAYEAAEHIAIETNKLVANCIGYEPGEYWEYDPKTIDTTLLLSEMD